MLEFGIQRDGRFARLERWGEPPSNVLHQRGRARQWIEPAARFPERPRYRNIARTDGLTVMGERHKKGHLCPHWAIEPFAKRVEVQRGGRSRPQDVVREQREGLADVASPDRAARVDLSLEPLVELADVVEGSECGEPGSLGFDQIVEAGRARKPSPPETQL
jgi:hypothetical protein